MRDVVLTMFGLTHTLHTTVGNDFIRGVSGGERKRVSIAECILSDLYSVGIIAFTTAFGNTILGVIIGESSLRFGIRRCLMVGVGSVFYNLGSDTGSFFSRGALPFL